MELFSETVSLSPIFTLNAGNSYMPWLYTLNINGISYLTYKNILEHKYKTF